MTTDTDSTLDAQVLADLAFAAAAPEPLDPDGLYSITVPEGATHEILDLAAERDARADRPRRRRGLVTAFDGDALVELVTQLGPEHGTVRLYGNPRAMTVTAVLNDDQANGDGGGGWRDHRVSFEVQRTRSWLTWTNGQGLGEQQKFAEHIEECRADIITPDAAEMLEIAQTFEASISATFSSGARLRDGARQLAYVEVIDGKGGNEGRLEIPEAMTVRLIPFEGGEPLDLVARIRYRIVSGRLQIGYSLHGWEDHEREAFDGICDRIEAALGSPILLGRPAD